jgi:hypothetical protein
VATPSSNLTGRSCPCTGHPHSNLPGNIQALLGTGWHAGPVSTEARLLVVDDEPNIVELLSATRPRQWSRSLTKAPGLTDEQAPADLTVS